MLRALACLAIAGCAAVPEGAVLSCCASVSSGFSGKPSAAYVAEALGRPLQDESGVCRRAHRHPIDFSHAAVVVRLDGDYWASYDRDCTAALEAIAAFYRATVGLRLIVATVPEVDSGWFHRTVCGAETAVQGCRVAINEALATGCGEGCMLLSPDRIYQEHLDLARRDVHLAPAVWRELGQEIVRALAGVP